MIANSLTLEVEIGRVLSSLAESVYRFYITGSRFFGTELHGSDWDFFVDTQIGLTDFLIANGFGHDGDGGGYYILEKNCCEIWKHNSLPIHIQIMDDFAEWKHLIQSTMFSIGLRYPSPRDWLLCCSLVEATKGEPMCRIPEGDFYPDCSKWGYDDNDHEDKTVTPAKEDVQDANECKTSDNLGYENDYDWTDVTWDDENWEDDPHDFNYQGE